MTTEEGNDDNPRRSLRVRNYPNSVFAKDFVGELWEKLQIRTDLGELEGGTTIDMHNINPKGQTAIEQHKQYHNGLAIQRNEGVIMMESRKSMIIPPWFNN